MAFRMRLLISRSSYICAPKVFHLDTKSSTGTKLILESSKVSYEAFAKASNIKVQIFQGTNEYIYT